MSRITQEQTRHFEIVEIGKETDQALELHRRLAMEFSGATKAIREFAEKGLHAVFEKVAQDLDAGTLSIDEATKVRVYLSQALHEANKVGRNADAQRLREEGAAGVLQGIVRRLETRRDAVVAKIDTLEAHEKAQLIDETVSIGGGPRGGIMAQRRAERLAEEAKASSAMPGKELIEPGQVMATGGSAISNAEAKPIEGLNSDTSATLEQKPIDAPATKTPAARRSKRRPALAAKDEGLPREASDTATRKRLADFSERAKESSEKLTNAKPKRTQKTEKARVVSAPLAAGESFHSKAVEPKQTPSQAAMRKLAQSARKLALGANGAGSRTDATAITESASD